MSSSTKSLLMDIKHVLSQHPQPTAYSPRPVDTARATIDAAATELAEGVVEVGAGGDDFCFDNGSPATAHC